MSGPVRSAALVLGIGSTLVACERDRPAGSRPAGDGRAAPPLRGTPPRRIVSVNPTATELLFALGLGARVVGRSAACDYPPDARRIPSVGGGLPPNLEAVLARRPDLVVLYAGVETAAAARRLRELGVPVLPLRTDRLEDLALASRRLGEAAGIPRSGDSLARALERALARARALEPPAAPRPSVLILAWAEPPVAIGRGSYLHELIELAGGRNALAESDRAAAPVAFEAIVARDPDLVAAVGEEPTTALARPEWRRVRAVREGRLLRLTEPGLARPSPRSLILIPWLRERLARAARRPAAAPRPGD